MIFDILQNAILQNIGPLKQAPKGWQKSCCKLCHTQGHGKDTRNRFGIQFNSGTSSILMNCFNCGFSASYTDGQSLSKSFKFFLKHINISDKFIELLEFEVFKLKNSISEVRDGDSTENKEVKLKNLFQKWHPMELPDDSLPITEWLDYGVDDPDFIRVVNYALSRRIYNLDNFYWSPIKSHNLNQRLIVPYYHKHKVVGFTARLCFNTPDKSIPKYFQQCPTDFVYNLDAQQDWSRKYVLVNEGVLDAWAVDGVGILGEIGQSKVDIINRLQKQVIVCPDKDRKGSDLVDVAIENNWAVSFPKWSHEIKDAAQASVKYGRLLTTHSIIDSAVTGKDKINLKWAIEQNARERKRN